MKTFTLSALITTLVLLFLTASSGQQIGECPEQELEFLPDINCTKYHVCSNGESVEMMCPSGLFFNPVYHECDFEDRVQECVGGTRPPGDITTTTQRPSSPEPSSTTENPNTILRACGEHVIGNEGVIEYKLGESYAQDERCAFVIRTLNYSGFTFTLEAHGIQEDPFVEGGPIVIFSFGHERHTDSSHLGPPNPLTQTYVYGSIAVVVFRTERLKGSGFRLSYKAVGYWDNQFKKGVDLTHSQVPGYILYPESGNNYTFDESSVIVISYKDQSVSNDNEILQINFTKVDIESCLTGCQCDSLTVYSYYTEAIKEESRICSGSHEPESLVFKTDGIFILFFQSDDTQNRGGFSAIWSIVERKNNLLTKDKEINLNTF